MEKELNKQQKEKIESPETKLADLTKFKKKVGLLLKRNLPDHVIVHQLSILVNEQQ